MGRNVNKYVEKIYREKSEEKTYLTPAEHN